VHSLTFHGNGGSLLGIHIMNVFFSILTLGLYYFWGKVRVRRYLMGQTEFEGDRFAYHGTGKELLIGFLKAMLALGIVYALFYAAPLLPGGTVAQVAVTVLAYVTLLVLIAAATVGARRYRLSRMSWRGIRFSFRGGVADFIRLYLKGVGLTLLTLGLYYPYFVARQQKFLVSYTHFGDERFSFDGTGRELAKIYHPWVLLSLLVLMAIVVSAVAKLNPSLGLPAAMLGLLPLLILPFGALYWFWFQAAKQRYLWNHTTFGANAARFRCAITGGRLCLLTLGNLLLLLLTLGIAWPWVLVRNARFMLTYLTLEGPLELATIAQEAQLTEATGEGLTDLLNMDAGLTT
jgi:uncharacterized membrane protein YjgN (DUF898 family)